MPITICGPTKFNKDYFNANPELLEYDKLNIVYDIDDLGLLDLYRTHDILVHATFVEAGHPPLTVIEAMSCGMPVVGTPMGDGVISKELEVHGAWPWGADARNPQEVKLKITNAIKNYDEYSWNARDRVLKNHTWPIIVHDMEKLYRNYVNGSPVVVKEKIEDLGWISGLVNIYNNADINTRTTNDEGLQIDITFDWGAKVEFSNGLETDEYIVEYYDKPDNKVYDVTLTSGMWTQVSPQWHVDWHIKIKNSTTDQQLVDYKYNLEGCLVNLIIDSSSLGDTIAWIPYVDDFKQKHKIREMNVLTHWSVLFKESYPDINFFDMGEFIQTKNPAAVYHIGWYYTDKYFDMDKHPYDPRLISLKQTASDILGLEYKEIQPKIDVPESISGGVLRIYDQPYITMCMQSTAQCKYWNYRDGWKEVVEYINKKYNHKVMCIDKTPVFGMGDCMNKFPDNAEDWTGNNPIEQRCMEIKNAKFHIGIGSGLSWLAHGIGKPVVLVSSFSKPFCEFSTMVERVYKDVPNSGYFNSEQYIFNRGEWNWNPITKCETVEDWHNFESIKPDDVFRGIDNMFKRIDKGEFNGNNVN